MRQIGTLLMVWALTLGAARANIMMEDPVEVTKAAYRTALAHFGFSPELLRPEKPYLAPDIYAALMKKANQPVAKGDAPDIEGDVIFNAQDVPDKYEVGHATISGTKAEVPVSLAWGSDKRRYIVRLSKSDYGAWQITDIDYGKDGKLSGLLK
jgi:hypothetical protein